jgi:hypothetical protein
MTSGNSSGHKTSGKISWFIISLLYDVYCTVECEVAECVCLQTAVGGSGRGQFKIRVQ